jgi:dCMP deaminase
MNLARGVASRSTCRVPDRKVGCVIVSGDNTKVLSIGYNGSAKGDDNSCEYSEDRKMVGDSRCTCLHSEMNSLVKLDTSNPCYKRMYLTLSPCSLCYKLIVNAGIDEVIYDIEYNAENIEKLRGLGVKVRKYEDN